MDRKPQEALTDTRSDQQKRRSRLSDRSSLVLLETANEELDGGIDDDVELSESGSIHIPMRDNPFWSAEDAPKFVPESRPSSVATITADWVRTVAEQGVQHGFDRLDDWNGAGSVAGTDNLAQSGGRHTKPIPENEATGRRNFLGEVEIAKADDIAYERPGTPFPSEASLPHAPRKLASTFSNVAESETPIEGSNEIMSSPVQDATTTVSQPYHEDSHPRQEQTEIFKTFRVSVDDACCVVLPAVS
jgi:hypothetical protein